MVFPTPHLLYVVFAFGALGIFYLLPQGRQSKPRAGAIFGGLALLAWIIVAGLKFSAGDGVYFLLFSTISLAAGTRVVTHQKPVYSALYFVVVVLAVAALLVLQQAEFLAISLIIIYAGAIMVTYLCVIMLAQQSGTPVCDGRSREPFLAVLMGLVLMAAIGGRADEMVAPAKTGEAKVARLVQTTSTAPTPTGNTAAMGAVLATEYVVVLEMAGLLLLISMVGAIALSRKRMPREGHAVTPMPLGQVGRNVEPF
jgi:NADH-quinone oxidoreductase subunit J